MHACGNVLDPANVIHVPRYAAEVGQLNVHFKNQKHACYMLIGVL